MFFQDNQDKPSVKKIILYSIAIFVFFVALGYIGERMGWV